MAFLIFKTLIPIKYLCVNLESVGAPLAASSLALTLTT